MAGDGGLDLLIETESRLAERLAAAQAEGAAVLEQARRDARGAEARYQVELETGREVLAARVAEERDSEITRLLDEASDLARRFRTLGQDRVESLAQEVVRRVLDVWRSETPG